MTPEIPVTPIVTIAILTALPFAVGWAGEQLLYRVKRARRRRRDDVRPYTRYGYGRR